MSQPKPSLASWKPVLTASAETVSRHIPPTSYPFLFIHGSYLKFLFVHTDTIMHVSSATPNQKASSMTARTFPVLFTTRLPEPGTWQAFGTYRMPKPVLKDCLVLYGYISLGCIMLVTGHKRGRERLPGSGGRSRPLGEGHIVQLRKGIWEHTVANAPYTLKPVDFT